MFMICHRMGRPPISTIGFGLAIVSSDRREPNPPARMTAFMVVLSSQKPDVQSTHEATSNYCATHHQLNTNRFYGLGAISSRSPHAGRQMTPLGETIFHNGEWHFHITKAPSSIDRAYRAGTIRPRAESDSRSLTTVRCDTAKSPCPSVGAERPQENGNSRPSIHRSAVDTHHR